MDGAGGSSGGALLNVYGEVIAIGERDLTGVLGCDANEAVDVCHGIESDFVAHLFNFLSDVEVGARADGLALFFGVLFA